MFIIHANIRKNIGKSESRRLRLKNKFPAIIYGGSENPIPIEIDHSSFLKIESKEKSNIFTLMLNTQEVKVKIKAVQYHPYKPKFTHIDFIRVL